MVPTVASSISNSRVLQWVSHIGFGFYPFAFWLSLVESSGQSEKWNVVIKACLSHWLQAVFERGIERTHADGHEQLTMTASTQANNETLGGTEGVTQSRSHDRLGRTFARELTKE